MGLFIIGYYIGKEQIYAELISYKSTLCLILKICFFTGLPLSCLYAWNAMNGYPFGLPGTAVLYTVSVFPLSFAYITAICLYFLRNKEKRIYKIVAATGKMALTNYLMQSVFGIILFYGIGFCMGAKTGLVHVEWIAFTVFLVQIICSNCWLHYFRFGPIEWGWRMLTYNKWLSIKK
jgi:uncharacterized protein